MTLYHLSNQQQIWLAQMQCLLAHNVPRFVKHIKDRGGVSDEEFRWLQCEEENSDYPGEVILRADEYLFYPKNQETFRKGLFVLTKTLAIMSFFPDGVRIFGLHFCDRIENFMNKEDEREA